jgi:hypothetical protein
LPPVSDDARLCLIRRKANGIAARPNSQAVEGSGAKVVSMDSIAA